MLTDTKFNILVYFSNDEHTLIKLMLSVLHVYLQKGKLIYAFFN